MSIYIKIQFIPVFKAVFSASLLQSDPSEIILLWWFVLKTNLWNYYKC